MTKMSTRRTSPYQQIIWAANRGTGTRLDADDCIELAMDTAIADAAANDDEAMRDREAQLLDGEVTDCTHEHTRVEMNEDKLPGYRVCAKCGDCFYKEDEPGKGEPGKGDTATGEAMTFDELRELGEEWTEQGHLPARWGYRTTMIYKHSETGEHWAVNVYIPFGRGEGVDAENKPWRVELRETVVQEWCRVQA